MILQEFSRYTSDTVGLEKFLRTLQGLLQLLLAISISPSPSPSPSSPIPFLTPPLTPNVLLSISIALKQIAITRRAFRYFRWIDFGSIAVRKFRGVLGLRSGGDGRDGEGKGNGKREAGEGKGIGEGKVKEGAVLDILEGGRAAWMAVYLFLEAWTILHAIGILTSPWGALVFFEAMKFWFYAISCSIVSLSYQLLILRENDKTKPSVASPEKTKTESPKEKQEKTVETGQRKLETPRNVLVWQLVGASCDLLIPGTFVGWLDVDPAIVAGASILSSVLSSVEIWKRVNNYGE